MRSLVLVPLVLLGCARFQRVTLTTETVRLPSGRFSGPLEFPVPRRAEHENHDFELRITLRAACAPKLTLAYPDGETEVLGEDDKRWQLLLAERAKYELPAQPVVEAPPPSPPPAVAAPPPLPPPPPARPGTAAVGVDIVIPLPQQQTGHWQQTRTETWSGQLEFERLRALRCSEVREYDLSYLNAFDETGMLTLWAEVPQELADAELRWEVIERVTPKAPPPPPPEEVVVEVRAPEPPPPPKPSKPRPPMPEPKRESPDPAEDPAAVWVPGHWVWHEGDGEWVWVEGWWSAPRTMPALKNEGEGGPPNPGATWARGHWEWRARPGRWEWVNGHWNAPPPRPENRGEPPGEGAPWTPGYWQWRVSVFVWVDGHWGKPAPRAESLPEPPFPGARWIPGDWIQVGGTYKWSPGFYEGSQRPPPPRGETPPPPPAPGAVWLQGYWRWSVELRVHEWVSGHWELPPGEGWVWIPDPPGPQGLIIRGHWELKVRPR